MLVSEESDLLYSYLTTTTAITASRREWRKGGGRQGRGRGRVSGLRTYLTNKSWREGKRKSNDVQLTKQKVRFCLEEFKFTVSRCRSFTGHGRLRTILRPSVEVPLSGKLWWTRARWGVCRFQWRDLQYLSTPSETVQSVSITQKSSWVFLGGVGGRVVYWRSREWLRSLGSVTRKFSCQRSVSCYKPVM